MIEYRSRNANFVRSLSGTRPVGFVGGRTGRVIGSKKGREISRGLGPWGLGHWDTWACVTLCVAAD